jgi:hypothetical protein
LEGILAKPKKKTNTTTERGLKRFAFYFSESDKEFMDEIAKKEQKANPTETVTLATLVRRACHEFVEREKEKVKTSKL